MVITNGLIYIIKELSYRFKVQVLNSRFVSPSALPKPQLFL